MRIHDNTNHKNIEGKLYIALWADASSGSGREKRMLFIYMERDRTQRYTSTAVLKLY
jgi:hypothetical protein